EFVLVVQGVGEDADAKLAEGRRVHAILARQLPPSAAARLAAEITGAPRKALYGGGPEDRPGGSRFPPGGGLGVRAGVPGSPAHRAAPRPWLCAPARASRAAAALHARHAA